MATEEIQEKQEIKESENETKLMASIEQIDSVAPHPNANRLVLVQILGYQMVVNPDSFGIPMDEYHKLKGIKGVMMYPDAVICKEWESDSLFAYLHDSHMGKRIKTVKIRGEYSQGLFLPLQLIEALLKNTRGLDLLDLGTDVTALLGLRKYYALDDIEKEVSISAPHYKKQTQSLPDWPQVPIPKTAQISLQKYPHLLTQHTNQDTKDRQWVATLKIDGQSSTFYYDLVSQKGGVCTRNHQVIFVDDKSNIYDYHQMNGCPPQFTMIEKQYDIIRQLGIYLKKNHFAIQQYLQSDFKVQGMALQGEIYGHKINSNRLHMKSYHFAAFDIYIWFSNHSGVYLPWPKMVEICTQDLNVPVVPVVMAPTMNPDLSLDYWLAKAEICTYQDITDEKEKTKSEKLIAEGIVLKTCDTTYFKPQKPKEYHSVKIISRAYLTKYGC